MTVFFEVCWDRHHGVYVRPCFDRIEVGDLPEAASQFEEARVIATLWVAREDERGAKS